jgi:hypothetical protein
MNILCMPLRVHCFCFEIFNLNLFISLHQHITPQNTIKSTQFLRKTHKIRIKQYNNHIIVKHISMESKVCAKKVAYGHRYYQPVK